MIGWIFRIIILFAILLAMYIALNWYYTKTKETDLKYEFEAMPKPEMDSDEFVAQEMIKFRSTLKRKLIFGIFLLPVAVFSLLLYIALYK